MIAVRSIYELNKNAIEFLFKMIIGGPRVSGFNSSAALHEFIALLYEQCELLTAKINEVEVRKGFEMDLAKQQYKDFLRTGDREAYDRTVEHYNNADYQESEYKRERSRLKAMLVVVEYRRENERKWLLAITLASHPRVGQASPMGMLKDDLLAKIALLTLS